MGFWVNLDGRVVIPKSEHFSIREYFKEVLNGDDYNLGIGITYSSDSASCHSEHINLSIEYDKEQLDKFLKKIDLDFKEKKIKCDLKITTRYVVN